MKLASIEKIVNILPIEGADKIELAQVLGYQTVVKKGEFKIGDYCVWHNPDTIVDGTNPSYEFLRKHNFRLKTAKFKGKFSQGLALPFSAFPTDCWHPSIMKVEGEDVSDAIHIKKYEKPIPACLAGLVYGDFPTNIIKKTDESLLLSNPEAAKELAGLYCVGTMKLDGSSGTFIHKDGEFMVCSRNLRLKETEGNSFWRIAKKYSLAENLARIGNIAIQGEVVGPGIQGNPMGLNEIDFYVFNVSYINADREYMDGEQAASIIAKLGLKIVPLVWGGNFPTENAIEVMQKYVNTLTYPNGKHAEGMVIRPIKETKSTVLDGRLSVKIINQNYID